MRNIKELYKDRNLYSSPDMFSPPSERLPHVIRFELTKGCNWGKCTFCGGYDGVRFFKKSLHEYKEHVDEVWRRVGWRSRLARSLGRAFIGGGNALLVGTEELCKVIRYTVDQFAENTGECPRRVSLYGRTKDILRHGKKGLVRLNHDAPLLIYWGIESGSFFRGVKIRK